MSVFFRFCEFCQFWRFWSVVRRGPLLRTSFAPNQILSPLLVNFVFLFCNLKMGSVFCLGRKKCKKLTAKVKIWRCAAQLVPTQWMINLRPFTPEASLFSQNEPPNYKVILYSIQYSIVWPSGAPYYSLYIIQCIVQQGCLVQRLLHSSKVFYNLLVPYFTVGHYTLFTITDYTLQSLLQNVDEYYLFYYG